MQPTLFASNQDTNNNNINTDLIEQLLTLAPNRNYGELAGFKVFNKLETEEEQEIRNSKIEAFKTLLLACNLVTLLQLRDKINSEYISVADECLDAIQIRIDILKMKAEGVEIVEEGPYSITLVDNGYQPHTTPSFSPSCEAPTLTK